MTKSVRRPELLVAWVLAAAVTAVDQLTKLLAVSRLSDGAVDVVWTLKLRLHFNTGMAFGAGSGASIGPVIAVGAFLIVLVLARSVRDSHGSYIELQLEPSSEVPPATFSTEFSAHRAC